MHYKDMILEAKSKGLANEEKMWESIEEVGELLEELKESHPDKYWMFMRKTHGMLHNHHYNEKFAKWDVAEMQPHGEYWSMKEVEDATKGLPFPNGTTLCDRYVALNAFYNDLHGVLPDDLIVKSAYAFWFADKDWEGRNKIWEYMCLGRKVAHK
jgi:hypothetical protein